MSSMLLSSLALAVFGGHGGCKSHRANTHQSCGRPMVVYAECCSSYAVGSPYSNASPTLGVPVGTVPQAQTLTPPPVAAATPASPAPGPQVFQPPAQKPLQVQMTPTPKPPAAPEPKPSSTLTPTPMTEKPTAAELSKFMQGTWRIVSSGSAKAQMPSPGDDIYEYRVAVNGDQMKIILRKGTFAFDGTFRIGALRPDGSAEIDLISREGTWPGLVKIRRSKQKYDPDSFTLNFRWSGSQDRLKDFDDETGGSVSSIAVFRGGREVE